jgi:hypothetical protein
MLMYPPVASRRSGAAQADEVRHAVRVGTVPALAVVDAVRESRESSAAPLAPMLVTFDDVLTLLGGHCSPLPATWYMPRTLAPMDW